VLGLLDDDAQKWGQTIEGVKVLGARDLVGQHPHAKVLAVPVRPDFFLKRSGLIKSLQLEDERFATLIAPSALVAYDYQIGVNSLIMQNVVIGPRVKIGKHCVILPNTTISHDCVIGDYCCIGANVVISGRVAVEEECYIGSGSNLINDITIGRKCLVGLGTNVVKDLLPEVVVAGNPARILRKVSE